ncbi:MAG TPA: ATP-binding cassette domain-containing protein, partial [Rhodospirillales bacterium]|nr:ATP-binding cassette domain-containing protein [Rhodospirillales bacterium]
GMMPNMIRRWNADNDRSMAFQKKASARGGAITAGSKFTRMFLQIGIMGAGAWLVINGKMLPGGMIAASILMGRALAPVEQAIGTWKNVIGARAAYGRIQSLLERTAPRRDSMALPHPEGRLSVEDVSYRYPGAKEPVVRHVGFVLDPGETLGLIGPSAAGKTTLAQLIVGNLEPAMGCVRLDGADLAKWPSDDRGRHIGYLPQDVELFSGKVRENIARMADGEGEPVVEAARMAGVHEMVLDLSEGYETEIGYGGAALSGGQRQRIALARAIYGNPSLVVLDEPSASLDVVGEEALLRAIAKLKKLGVTIVIIAHRPNVLMSVDKILVLRDGAVQAFGPRDEILARIKGEAAHG